MTSSTHTEHTFSEKPARFNNFLRFIAYVKPYKWNLVIAVIGGVVKFTLPLLVPQITRHLLDEVFLKEAKGEPHASRIEMMAFIANLNHE